MKKLLLLLLAIPAASIAQRKQIGVNAGTQVWPEVGPEVYGSVRYLSEQDVTIAGIGIDGGAGAELVSLNFINIQGDNEVYKDRAKSSYVTLYGFANYKLPFSDKFYAGGLLGYFIIGEDAYAYKEVNAATPYIIIEKNRRTRRTLALGLQAGYNADISGKLAFNAEVGARLVPLPGTRMFHYPMSIGFRYRIN